MGTRHSRKREKHKQGKKARTSHVGGVYECAYILVHTYMSAYVCVHVCLSARVCKCVHVNMHVCV